MKAFSKFVLAGFIMMMCHNSFLMAEEMTQAPNDQEAKMAKMEAMMAPGPEHALLADLEGEWSYTAKFWMTPDAQPEETTGTSDQYLIYDDRFLEQDIEGTWMEKPFEGTGILGYDRIRGEYVSTWFDNMATGIMTITGQYDPATKTIHLSGTVACPMTGDKNQSVRVEYILTDEDHHAYHSYTIGPDGKEFKQMEIEYTREV
ncbi:MAG: hypothetical protein COV74_03995 [Candidatus Omnitrophica bacterium CG11_big_fil_rev_8_21_14_0_20_45_26]|uniref:DUF1579 domain-containing protein n=1 Tax=Candidatus Abzuiibacterium crystallinum TaxID=1974748 RepID=A0A2H0LT12_9BACT|nr:MAG: hypothetical protein COV74_03995 [Candidatus Omnitrophica bacterium CG11_big_fil_rev_8_21_14_0_20_45_26]PIW63288.1 MAG: hypothetical protein COW12_10955 [Candidatus Omnitrophica bacterium CG12_big_fil_rev_8_21_14_0_65_45_16]